MSVVPILIRQHLIVFILFVNITFAQSSIVAGGNSNITIGDTFGIMRTDMKEKEVSLGVPKFEVPKEPQKPIVKKKTFFQKLIEAILKIFKK